MINKATTALSARDIAETEWRKSSYSATNEAECIEIAETPGTVHVRDSKDKTGPTIAFSPAGFSAFAQAAANGAFTAA